MACGLPVIVSDMVGAKQVVEQQRNGFVVPSGDVDALVNKMRWFLQNKGCIGRMSMAARATAEDLSWTKYRLRFAAAVQEVLRPRSALIRAALLLRSPKKRPSQSVRT